jgi:uncharacterized protein YceH (UPF0502 family)
MNEFAEHDPEFESENEVAKSLRPLLTLEEARVLGCLMEKSVTTPEYYPLTFNALVAACNQKSNRHPMVAFDDDVVEIATEGLREKGLAARISVAGSRVPKYKHNVMNKLVHLEDEGFALLCVLLLRGQQTLGELRTRTERIHAFPTLEATQSALDQLRDYPERPMVKFFAAGGGRRVPTFVHLLCGDVVDDVHSMVSAPVATETVGSWKDDLQAEVEALREEMAVLKAEFAEFRTQFE